MKFPEHKCSLHLEHNPHKAGYEPIAQWVACPGNRMYDWKDDESKRRSIATNEVWTLQWYPDTPIGFCAVAAPTLQEVLELANQDESLPVDVAVE